MVFPTAARKLPFRSPPAFAGLGDVDGPRPSGDGDGLQPFSVSWVESIVFSGEVLSVVTCDSLLSRVRLPTPSSATPMTWATTDRATTVVASAFDSRRRRADSVFSTLEVSTPRASEALRAIVCLAGLGGKLSAQECTNSCAF